jgi:hypothetical protein
MGICFVFISVILFSLKYIMAAIVCASSNHSFLIFDKALDYVDNTPLNLSVIIALVIGLGLIIFDMIFKRKAV